MSLRLNFNLLCFSFCSTNLLIHFSKSIGRSGRAFFEEGGRVRRVCNFCYNQLLTFTYICQICAKRARAFLLNYMTDLFQTLSTYSSTSRHTQIQRSSKSINRNQSYRLFPKPSFCAFDARSSLLLLTAFNCLLSLLLYTLLIQPSINKHRSHLFLSVQFFTYTLYIW